MSQSVCAFICTYENVNNNNLFSIERVNDWILNNPTQLILASIVLQKVGKERNVIGIILLYYVIFISLISIFIILIVSSFVRREAI